MNNNLAPKYEKKFDDFWVLWYEKSNSYSVVDTSFKNILDFYFSSSSDMDFKSRLLSAYDNTYDLSIIKTIEEYLTGCHKIEPEEAYEVLEVNTSKRLIQKQYKINEIYIQINYDSELVKQVIHPAIAYLERSEKSKPNVIYDIYIEDSNLCLFKDEKIIKSVPKRDYHLLQGKFIMELLCVLYHKTESDWIGTFHGSTISDGNNCIMFVGLSGKGKSTLTAILAANKFELVTDDVSPLLAEDLKIYNNPSAISIKHGAFEILKPWIKNFEDYPLINFNKNKGFIKYIPFNNLSEKSYKCKAIVMVNYTPNSKTNIEKVTVAEVLETIIPDSWISNKDSHSQKFLAWLATLHFYKITYSDTKSVVATISELFNRIRYK